MREFLKRLWIVGSILLISGCSSVSEYQNSPQYSVENARFQHPSGKRNDKSFGELVKLFWKFNNQPADPHGETGFPVVEPAFLGGETFQDKALWVGHSTVLLNYDGLTILCDPQFSNRASPFSFAGPKRRTPLPFEIEDLPPVDVVLISHNHYDHLDEASIKALVARNPDIHILVPLGDANLVRQWGAKQVTELDWWQTIEIKGVKFQPTAVQHWSKRGLFDRNKSLWSGWMVDWPDYRYYFTGDTGYSDDFKETFERLGPPDLAAIPIGAYKPRDFMAFSHVDPTDAIRIFQDLGAKQAFAIHWGTFKLTLEPLAEPPALLSSSLEASGISADKFRVLMHGESIDLKRKGET